MAFSSSYVYLKSSGEMILELKRADSLTSGILFGYARISFPEPLSDRLSVPAMNGNFFTVSCKPVVRAAIAVSAWLPSEKGKMRSVCLQRQCQQVT
jgi:hypothetical protein